MDVIKTKSELEKQEGKIKFVYNASTHYWCLDGSNTSWYENQYDYTETIERLEVDIQKE
jgi:hypothetical protein